MDYLIVIEETSTGFSAYAPDLPGCKASGKNFDAVCVRMREAVEFHIEGLRLKGVPVPRPRSKAVFFDLGTSGAVTGERRVEALYDIKAFAAKAGITPSTARVYAHRFGIGRKFGRGWVFTDTDLKALPTNSTAKAKKKPEAAAPGPGLMMPEMLLLAQKYCWWKKSEESLAYPQRVIAAVMDRGTFADTQLLVSLVGEAGLREALARAEPGQFRPKSWAYWQYRLNSLCEHSLPTLPKRVIP